MYSVHDTWYISLISLYLHGGGIYKFAEKLLKFGTVKNLLIEESFNIMWERMCDKNNLLNVSKSVKLLKAVFPCKSIAI